MPRTRPTVSITLSREVLQVVAERQMLTGLSASRIIDLLLRRLINEDPSWPDITAPPPHSSGK